jgi:uncharacterized protein (DUF2235 family)
MTKKIAVFADGTGNAFTVQESNVWRLYQAIDWSQPDQIAHYIKGVGTSGVRAFALIDGATGIGVPSNVRKLYRFLCWNWNHGDEIYMFGFSRGAFTIRSLIGLINEEGLVPRDFEGDPVSHAEMQRNAMAAWRAYRRKSIPWHRSLPTIWVARAIRDALLWVYHRLLRHRCYSAVCREIDNQSRRKIPVTFVGLFDTVEAYGVPIEELRKAIDWAIWPISFRNHTLSTNVERARHALSLDDERTTFHPIRFDMTLEKTDRIQEVWFAGVHSDVGGGYPDSALAHVPLVWIAEETEIKVTNPSSQPTKTGLRFVPSAIENFRAAASALGPRHDSRSGLAVMYRYDPRRIAEDKASGGPPVIHYSVAEKMVFGTDDYAPITLPSSAFVLLPDGTKQAIKGFGAKAAPTVPAGVGPETGRALRAVRALSVPNTDLASLTLDTVWWRRVAYYALLVSLLLAASLPLTAYKLTSAFKSAVGALLSLIGLRQAWERFWDWLGGLNDGVSTNLHSISKTIGGFLPGYLKYWIDVAVARPITSGLVLVLVLLLYWANGALRDLICDRARLAWFFTGRKVSRQSVKPGLLMRLAHVLRESRLARGLYRGFAEIVLPAVALIVIVSVAAMTASRTTVSYRAGRGGGDFCKKTDEKLLVTASDTPHEAASEFEIDRLCWPSGIKVEKGRHYTLWIEMNHPFFDQTIMTDVAGFRDLSLRYVMALPIRRHWSADWFQPIARIGAGGNAEWALIAVDGSEALELGQDVAGKNIDNRFYEAEEYAPRLAELHRGEAKADPSRLEWCAKLPDKEYAAAEMIRNEQNLRRTYVSQFAAPESGELFLYVNDAIAAVPFGPTVTCFYNNNRGSAKVTIQSMPVPKRAATQASLKE